INNQSAGRTVKPCDDDLSEMVRNVHELTTGQQGFSYAGSVFHRVIPQFMLQ
ncbi:hypothetical protein HD554DRAFT_2006836, partial [Boletus coccyginus]